MLDVEDEMSEIACTGEKIKHIAMENKASYY